MAKYPIATSPGISRKPKKVITRKPAAKRPAKTVKRSGPPGIGKKPTKPFTGKLPSGPQGPGFPDLQLRKKTKKK